jgi:16S rRNA (guanine966-N2)-methyltransferase
VTRVIAGADGGRRLTVPGGDSTRPTSDRAREGLFGTVVSEIGSLAGKHVLDLYAGSGAIGLEALSRGARDVLMVESDAQAVAVIRANIATVGMEGARVIRDRVERVLARTPAAPGQAAGGSAKEPPGAPAASGASGTSGASGASGAPDSRDGPDRYDLVFADPPYAMTVAAVTRMLSLLADGWLADDALVVVERATRSGPVHWPPGYLPGKSRRYGEATFWYGWNGGTIAGGRGQTPRTALPAHEE